MGDQDAPNGVPSQSQSRQEDHDVGPGQQYAIYLQNEALVDRLKLLNYEKEFVPMSDSYKCIPRHYFVKQRNPGEQFFLFTTLASWLAQKAGVGTISIPQEFDDPNMTLSSIIDAMKSKDIDCEYPPSRLRSGSGEACLYVLDKLSAAALDYCGFQFDRPKPVDKPVEDEEGEEHVDEAEITADQFEDDEAPLAEDEDDATLAIDMGGPAAAVEDVLDGNDLNAPLQGIMQTFNEPQTLKAEVERVTPQLRITIRSNNKDWRMHLEQIQKLENAIKEQFDEVRPYLAHVSQEIAQSMERVESRERNLNQQLDHLLQQYRAAQNNFAEIRERYREASSGIRSREDTLNKVTEEVEQIKQQIEEQTAQNTSGAPILKIKKAIAELESSILTMSVQIAVIEQSISQAQLNDRANLSGLDLMAGI